MLCSTDIMYYSRTNLGLLDIVDVRGVHERGEVVKLLPDLRLLLRVVAGKGEGALEVQAFRLRVVHPVEGVVQGNVDWVTTLGNLRVYGQSCALYFIWSGVTVLLGFF